MTELHSHKDRYLPAPRTPTSSASFQDTLVAAVRDNPVSAALIAMGAVWLFAGGSKVSLLGGSKSRKHRGEKHKRERGFHIEEERVHHYSPSGSSRGAMSGVGSAVSSGAASVRDGLSAVGSNIGEGAGYLGDKVSEAAESGYSSVSGTLSAAAEGLASMSHRTSSMASSAANSIGERSQNAATSVLHMLSEGQDDLKDALERYPLLVGAAGLAIGAGIAAALPTTETENRLLGEESDAMKAQAQSVVSEQLRSARDLAHDTFEDLKREAQAQGLSEEAALAAIKRFREKLAHVSATAREEFAELGAKHST
ncbi:hypothetical protein FHS85_003226 [Rhodoligotrophos appendicifer]|uniref:hypothetical protein n=1 Tax=Rhodoligotrophos appendicifer TaxID=987056 RepID=UPI001186C2A0|nr:hypothetical protein [Rhodoligotrophos appendicifer]